MSLPTTPPISMSQVATELGTSLPLSMDNGAVLALAGKTSLPCSMYDLLGGTKLVLGAAIPSGGVVGFVSGVAGTVTPGTYLGVSVTDLTTLTGGVLRLRMQGSRAQNFFDTLITPIGNVNSGSALYSVPGSYTQWEWVGSYAFVNANNYNIYISL